MTLKFRYKEAANIPPAYRKPLNMLIAGQKNNDLEIIPFTKLFFVFEGFRLSHAKTISVIIELEKIGVFKVIPGVGVRLLLARENDC